MTGTALSDKKYRAYPEYKDSGIEWIGKVPVSWEETKLGRLVFMQEGPGLRTWQFKDAGTRVICVTNITDNGIDFNRLEKFISNDEYLAGYKRFTVNKGDVLLSSSGNSWGKVSVYNGEEKVILNTSTIRLNELKEKKVLREFLPWLLLSEPVKEQLDLAMTGACQPNFGPSHLNEVIVPIIPKDEQQKIANFLDHETAKIDTLITKQEKLIELLKEKRQAVISHAVTRGLNPDAQMKDSGVEWLGEVPEHWTVKKLKYCACLISQKSFIGDKPVIALENIESFTGKHISTNSNYTGEDVEVSAGDVLFGKLRPYLAKVFLCERDSIAFGDILSYRSSKEMLSKFLFYSMISEWFIEIVDSSTYGAKMPRASSEFISDMEIAVPPIEEQLFIINELENTLNKFEKLTGNAIRAIKLMKERKTALISAAVTGKIDVRNWQV